MRDFHATMTSSPEAPTPSHPPARLQLHGAARAEIEGRPLALGRRLAPLLALVALDGPIARARLAALLYPQLQAAAARRNLRQLLFGQHALLERLIDMSGDHLSLRADVRLEAGASTADANADNPIEPLLGPQRFDDLPEFQEWLDSERERQHERDLDRLAALASQLEGEGRLARALTIAQQLVAQQPTSEHVHRRLMRLHFLRGDPAAALAAFDHCEQVLKDELSASPGPETLALRRQVEGAIQKQPAQAAGGAVATATPEIRKPLPPGLLRPPRLIGRDHERAQLQASWDEHEAAIVIGEAGLGKTRLLSDFAAEQDAAHEGGAIGARVVIVAARAGDDRLPYALLGRLVRRLMHTHALQLADAVRQALAPVIPELGPGPAAPGDIHRGRFVQAMAPLIDDARSNGLQAIVLDDLHHADSASIEVLQHVAQPDHLRWILAFRAGELSEAGQALTHALEESMQVRVIALEPLTPQQVETLVDSLAIEGLDGHALAPGLHQRTGGNPLFVLETLKAMLHPDRRDTALVVAGARPRADHLPAPPAVGAVLDRRLAALSPPAVRLARFAALAGADFDADLAAQVLHATPFDLVDPWRELEEAGVIRGDAFAHDLIREAAIRSVPLPIARSLHRALARHLVEQRGDAQRIAEHYQRAGDLPAAAPFLERAAEHARQLRATDRALELYAQAVDALEAAQAIDAAVALCHRWFELADDSTRLDQCIVILQRAERMAHGPQASARVALLRAIVHARQGDDAQVIACAEAALAIGLAHIEPRLRMQLDHVRIGALLRLGRHTQAKALMDDCEARMPSLVEDADTAGAMLNNMGTYYGGLGRLDDSARLFRQGIAFDHARGRMLESLDAMVNLGVNRMHAGRLLEARTCFDQARRVIATVDAEESLPLVLTEGNLARVEADLGHFAVALPGFERALLMARDQLPAYRPALMTSLARAWSFLGQWARCDALLREVRATPGLPPIMRVTLALAETRRSLMGAHPDASGTTGLTLDTDARDSDVRGVRCLAHYTRALTAAPRDALDAARTAREAAQAQQLAGMSLMALVRMTDAARQAGDIDHATRLAHQCLDEFETTDPDSLYRPELWWVAWQALDAARDAAAPQVLARAVAWVRDTANLHVPPAFRDSFLHRNPVNQSLLGAAAQLGLA